MIGFPKTPIDFSKNQPVLPSQLWQARLDQQAQFYLNNQNFFSQKTEDWKHFPFQKVMKQNFVFNFANHSLLTEDPSPCLPSSLVLSIRNGKICPSFQNTKDLFVCSWKDFLLSKQDVDLDIKNKILNALKKQRNPFCSLNNALWTNGLILIIKQKLSQPLEIHYTHIDKNEQQGLNLRNFIFLDDHSSAQILEVYHSRKEKKALFLNIQTDCFIGNSAHLEHSRVDQAMEKDIIINQLFADLSPKSSSCFFTLSLNAGISRYLSSLKQEEKSSSNIRGLSLLDGTKYADHKISVTHKGKKSVSHQVYKSFLFDSARHTFQGKTTIERLAQKSNASQSSKNLLLGKRAFAAAFPELDITADDVTAVHGATVSPWEENKNLMFYLQSRGVEPFQAFHLIFSSMLIDTLSCLQTNTKKLFHFMLENKINTFKSSVQKIFT